MNLEDIERAFPEWSPWLAVVADLLQQIHDPVWPETIPASATPARNGAPLLNGALIPRQPSIPRLFNELCRRAARSDATAMKGLRDIAQSEAHAYTAFLGALNGEEAALCEMATRVQVSPDALVAVASLLPVPFLHACSQRWAADPRSGWGEGYCPVCGSWPALAEICGVERSRYLRCGRCGAAWEMHCLSCPYCGMADHAQLGSLVAEHDGVRCVIEVCNRCSGYVKALNKLRADPSVQVMIDDLATVSLDIAAAERGYRRPAGTGHKLDVAFADALTSVPVP